MLTRKNLTDVQRLESVGVEALLVQASGELIQAVTVNGNVRKADALLNDGDVLAVDPRPIIADGEIALLTDNELLALRRVYRESDGIRLVPLDPRCGITKIRSLAEVEIHGRVVTIIRRVRSKPQRIGAQTWENSAP